MENDLSSIDGSSEYIITHPKKSRTKELIACIFWSIIGIGFIVLGALLSGEIILIRIISIISGSLLFFIFLESYITKLTNKIILTPNEIKTRKYFKWEKMPWISIRSLEIDKRTSNFMNKESEPRYTILKIKNHDNSMIIYPLYRFERFESNKIVELIKIYYNANQENSITEKILQNNK